MSESIGELREKLRICNDGFDTMVILFDSATSAIETKDATIAALTTERDRLRRVLRPFSDAYGDLAKPEREDNFIIPAHGDYGPVDMHLSALADGAQDGVA